MSTQKQSPTSRFFRFLRTKTEPGSKGNTIKKAAPEAQINESTQDKLAIQPSHEDSSFPREYYKPRPVPQSFVVGEVRKVSNNGSPPDSIKAQDQVPKTVAATRAEDAAGRKNAVSSTADPEKSLMTAAESDAPVELIAGTSATGKSVHANSVSNGVYGERSTQPTFDLLLGQQDPSSPYFTRRYFSEAYVADVRDATKPPRDILHHISELDSQAFEMYKMYTNTGKIGFRCLADVKNKYLWIACWPLMNAHILGCIIEEPAFADRVMNFLVEKLPLGLAPDFKTVEHLFDGNRKGISDALKTFVADRFVNAQQQSHVVLDTSTYPETFQEAALQSALRHLAYSQDTDARPGCTYHTHHDKELCYKTRLTPVDTLKEQRLAVARENSARDAEFVIANALQNGVKSVDWEQRRAAAKQALRIDTVQAWTTSWLLDGGDQADRNTSTSPHANGTSDSTHTTDRKANGDDDVILVANLSRQTDDLTRTPNNSPVLQSRSAKTHLITSAPSLASTNGHAPASETAVFPIVVPIQSSNAFLLAELDGNGVNAARPTALAVKYRSSVERMRASGSHGRTTLVSTDDAGGRVPDSDGLGDGATASDRRVGELSTEYERCVSCPGAYPRSDVGI